MRHAASSQYWRCLIEPDAEAATAQLLDSSARCPQLRLGHGADLTPALVAAVREAAHAGRLVSFSLGTASGVGPDGLARLLAAVHGSSLAELSLGAASIDDAGAAHLAASLEANRLPALRSLHLGVNRLGPASARALASSATRGLHTLRLGLNSLGVGGALAFADAMYAGCTLRSLDLGINRIFGPTAEPNPHAAEAAARLFGALPRCAELKELRLGVNPVGRAATAPLAAAAAALTSLRRVSLGACGIDGHGAAKIAAAMGAANATVWVDAAASPAPVRTHVDGGAECAAGARVVSPLDEGVDEARLSADEFAEYERMMRAREPAETRLMSRLEAPRRDAAVAQVMTRRAE